MLMPSSAVLITPNAVASLRGTRIPATVASAPVSMWSATICDGSIR